MSNLKRNWKQAVAGMVLLFVPPLGTCLGLSLIICAFYADGGI